MDKREQLKSIKEKIDSLSNQTSDISKEIWEWSEKQSSTICEIILEDKLLEGTHWTLSTGTYQTQLDYAGKLEDQDKIDKIEKLWSGDYADLFLEPGMTLHVNDEGAYLQFDDPKLMPAFVQKHKLIVDGGQIIKRLRELRREISALEVICHQFNIKG